MDHPNIVKVLEIRETAHFYQFVYEYATFGTLKDQMFTKGFTENEIKHVMRQIVYAVNSLHESHIVHRDLKPDNILVYDMGPKGPGIKINEFHFSTRFDGETPTDSLKLKLGSRLFMPPELIKTEQGKTPD